MASSIETTSTTTTLKNNGNTYMSVDTNDDVAITNTLTATSPTFVTPALGTPASGTLTNCSFPTLNQNTSGTAAGLSATLAVGSGGTGATSMAAAGVVIGAGTGAVTTIAPSTSGNVLTSNGSSWSSVAASGGVTPTRQIFTSGGTWSRPSGCTKINVRVQGAGGQGLYQFESGGGGGYSEKLIDVTSISSVTVTVGTTPAALSSFGSHCTGGGGATATSGQYGGAGGTATGGDINIDGQDGGGDAAPFFGGGSSFMGHGGELRQYGGQANGYGGGNGGSPNGAYAAAFGGAGIVIVEEFY